MRAVTQKKNHVDLSSPAQRSLNIAHYDSLQLLNVVCRDDEWSDNCHGLTGLSVQGLGARQDITLRAELSVIKIWLTLNLFASVVCLSIYLHVSLFGTDSAQTLEKKLPCFPIFIALLGI